jgi:hypothetical protein
MSVAADASGLFWEDEDVPVVRTTGIKRPTHAIPVWAWIIVWVLYDLGTLILVAALVTSGG